MQSTRRIFAGLTLALPGACRDAPAGPLEEPLAVVCERVRAVTTAFPDYPGFDDWFEGAARLVPGGFAGAYGGHPGTTIVLVHPDSLPAARRSAARARECLEPGDFRTVVGYVSAAVVAVPGRYDWVQLRGWYRAIFAALDATAGLRRADINEVTNRLEFGVTDTAAVARLEALARRLGVPADAIAVSLATF